jgi:hypothetical protein
MPKSVLALHTQSEKKKQRVTYDYMKPHMLFYEAPMPFEYNSALMLGKKKLCTEGYLTQLCDASIQPREEIATENGKEELV